MGQETKNIRETEEKDICVVRKHIEYITHLLAKFNPKTNPTTVLYLERALFYIKVNSKIIIDKKCGIR